MVALLALLLGGCSATQTAVDRTQPGATGPSGVPATSVIATGGAFEAEPLPLYVAGTRVERAQPWRGPGSTATAGDLTAPGDGLLRPAQG